MSTERTPLVTDEQIDDLAESFVDRKTTRAIESPMRIREEVLCGNFASEIRTIYEAALASKDAEIEALRNPWISVKDRLPEQHTDVICHSQFGAIGTGYLITTSEWSGWEMRQIGSCAVTHWMPLPTPPKP